MDNIQIPPEYKEEFPRKKVSYGKKVFMLALQCIVLMIGALIIYGLIYSREDSNERVVWEITEKWGSQIEFKGVQVIRNDGFGVSGPQIFNCNANIKTQTLHRGIYEAEVYTAVVKVKEVFSKNKLEKKEGDKITLMMLLPPNSVEKLGSVIVCGKKYDWNKVDQEYRLNINIEKLPDDITVETSFTVHGSRGFYVQQIGEENTIIIDGEAPNPSFNGNTLPVARSMNHGKEFSAKWEGSGNERNTKSRLNTYESQIVNEDYDYVEYYYDPEPYGKGMVGTDFLVGLERYQKVTRTLKYSFIIIILTYIAVLFVEVIRRRPVPLLNYFLIGVALIIFYTLLLSFAELMAFGLAYLIAAVMTIGLITLYMGMLMRSKKVSLLVGGILTVYYGACFVMLSSTYALLIGSLLLFGAIAVMMYATLKVRTR